RIQELMRNRYARHGHPEEGRPLNLEKATVLSRLDNRSVLCLGQDEAAARFMMRLVEMAGGHFTHDPAGDADDIARIEREASDFFESTERMRRNGSQTGMFMMSW
ncbi:MAG TPA: hypothetical protein DCL53_16290, partial [Thauera sp.]|nr:hypothetical protein [Thauera sp.]